MSSRGSGSDLAIFISDRSQIPVGEYKSPLLELVRLLAPPKHPLLLAIVSRALSLLATDRFQGTDFGLESFIIAEFRRPNSKIVRNMRAVYSRCAVPALAPFEAGHVLWPDRVTITIHRSA